MPHTHFTATSVVVTIKNVTNQNSPTFYQNTQRRQRRQRRHVLSKRYIKDIVIKDIVISKRYIKDTRYIKDITCFICSTWCCVVSVISKISRDRDDVTETTRYIFDKTHRDDKDDRDEPFYQNTQRRQRRQRWHVLSKHTETTKTTETTGCIKTHRDDKDDRDDTFYQNTQRRQRRQRRHVLPKHTETTETTETTRSTKTHDTLYQNSSLCVSDDDRDDTLDQNTCVRDDTAPSATYEGRPSYVNTAHTAHSFYSSFCSSPNNKVSQIKIVPCHIKRVLYTQIPQMPHVHITAASVVVPITKCHKSR